MNEVRTSDGYPTVSDFVSRIGTPIVIDGTTGYAYILLNGAIVSVFSVSSADAVLTGRTFVTVPPNQDFQNSQDVFSGRTFVTQPAGATLYQTEAMPILATQVFGG